MENTFFESKLATKVERKVYTRKEALVKKSITKIIGTLIIPLIFIGISFILALSRGKNLIQSEYDVQSLVNTSIISYLALIAVSINLISGRMDFSLGSIGVLAPMLALKITNGIEGGNALFFPLCILFGIVLGILSSCAYIFLRLPAIVSGLGVCIFYEGITQALLGTSGNLYYESQFDSLRNNVVLSISLAIIAFIAFYLLIKYTKYWMNKKALNSNQIISVDTGIKEIPNTIISYAVAGLFMALSGALSSLNIGYLQQASNFSSATAVFDFFPLGIGMICGIFSNPALGLLLGAFTNKIFILGLSKTGILSAYQMMVTPVLMFTFLIFVFTGPRIINYFKTKIAIKHKNKIDFLLTKNKEIK